MRSLIVLAIVALAGCNRDNANNAGNASAAGAGGDAHPEWVVGRWASTLNIGSCRNRAEMEFLAGGSAAFDGQAATWQVEGDRLVLGRADDGMETIVKIRFQRDGDRIVMLGGPRQTLLRCVSAAAQEAERMGLGTPLQAPPAMPTENVIDPAANAVDDPMMDMNAH
jgi:hypothetical protein